MQLGHRISFTNSVSWLNDIYILASVHGYLIPNPISSFSSFNLMRLKARNPISIHFLCDSERVLPWNWRARRSARRSRRILSAMLDLADIVNLSLRSMNAESDMSCVHRHLPKTCFRCEVHTGLRCIPYMESSWTQRCCQIKSGIWTSWGQLTLTEHVSSGVIYCTGQVSVL